MANTTNANLTGEWEPFPIAPTHNPSRDPATALKARIGSRLIAQCAAAYTLAGCTLALFALMARVNVTGTGDASVLFGAVLIAVTAAGAVEVAVATFPRFRRRRNNPKQIKV